jgi:hypothetical protein
MTVLTSRALNRATLARQLLLERHRLPAATVVERLAGLQAQVPRDPYVALWARLDGFDAAELGGAIERRELVRTVLMRATIHLATAADALATRMLFQPILDREMTVGAERRELGASMSAAGWAALEAAGHELLAEKPLTLAELRGQLAGRFPGLPPAALAYALRNRLTLVQTPPRGVWGKAGATRFATVESWLGRSAEARPDPAAMVRRYLAALGPATVADVQAWSGLTRLREVVDALRPELVTFRDEAGRELFDLPGAPRPGPDVPAPVRLLPTYDNLLLSHADRSRFVADADRRRFVTANGVGPGTVLVDGRVAGVWLRPRTPPGPFAVGTLRPLTPAGRDEVSAEAARLLELTGEGPGGGDPATFAIYEGGAPGQAPRQAPRQASSAKTITFER